MRGAVDNFFAQKPATMAPAAMDLQEQTSPPLLSYDRDDRASLRS